MVHPAVGVMMDPGINFDLGYVARVCVAVVSIVGALLYLAKIHRDWFIKPWIKKELTPINTQLTLIARLLREKYREEYEQAQDDVERETKMKGLT
jgi:hypothetical protein